MSLADTRFDQLFPVLDAGQIETARRFASGPARTFAPDERVYDVGVRNAPAWLVLGGWFVIQAFYSNGAGVGTGAGVAYLAHVVGFVAGALVALAFREHLVGNHRREWREGTHLPHAWT